MIAREIFVQQFQAALSDPSVHLMLKANRTFTSAPKNHNRLEDYRCCATMVLRIAHGFFFLLSCGLFRFRVKFFCKKKATLVLSLCLAIVTGGFAAKKLTTTGFGALTCLIAMLTTGICRNLR